MKRQTEDNAREPSAEEAARSILVAFVALNPYRGAALRIRRIRRRFHQAGAGVGDFQCGIGFALEANWIEPVSAATYRLTDIGLAEAPSLTNGLAGG